DEAWPAPVTSPSVVITNSSRAGDRPRGAPSSRCAPSGAQASRILRGRTRDRSRGGCDAPDRYRRRGRAPIWLWRTRETGSRTNPGGTRGRHVGLAAWLRAKANVAKELRLPRDVVRVADMITPGRRRRVSVGRAGRRYFVLMAGVGMDAAVVRPTKSEVNMNGPPPAPPAVGPSPQPKLPHSHARPPQE